MEYQNRLVKLYSCTSLLVLWVYVHLISMTAVELEIVIQIKHPNYLDTLRSTNWGIQVLVYSY